MPLAIAWRNLPHNLMTRKQQSYGIFMNVFQFMKRKYTKKWKTRKMEKFIKVWQNTPAMLFVKSPDSRLQPLAHSKWLVYVWMGNNPRVSQKSLYFWIKNGKRTCNSVLFGWHLNGNVFIYSWILKHLVQTLNTLIERRHEKLMKLYIIC